MKRTPMPPRKKPLVSRTELTTTKPLLRRCALSPVSDKRRRDNVERVRVVNGMRLAAQGRCARCGRRDQPVHGHERRGGSFRHRTFIRPDCLLCNECNGWAEDHPQVAAETGWKVSSKYRHDPALSPTQARALDGSIVEFETVTDGAA